MADRSTADPARRPAGKRLAACAGRRSISTPAPGRCPLSGARITVPTPLALSPLALDIVRAVPQTDRDHLFGDRANAGFTGWSNAKLEIDRRLVGAVKPWRVHDIRRTVATRMADIGIEPHHIEAALNHYGGHRRGAAGVYNRSSYAIALSSRRWRDGPSTCSHSSKVARAKS